MDSPFSQVDNSTQLNFIWLPCLSQTNNNQILVPGKGKGHHAKKQGNSSNSSATIHEVKEALQKVGSQKRKARKESITRRDVNTVAEEVLAQQGGGGDDETAGNTSDLLILATLAAGEIGTQQ